MEDMSGDIYVTTELDERGLILIVSEAIDGLADAMGNIDTSIMSLSVRRNPDREAPFLGRSGYLVEYEPKGNISKKDVVTALTVLLQSMWNHGIRTETACDYEDELPYSGRYDGSTCTPIVYYEGK